jgi:hypothetical protein
VTSDAVDAVFQRALAVRPQDRFQDAGSFWKALVLAHNSAAASASVKAPEIPDLVPVSRKPSGMHKLELPAMHQLDFDGDDHGPSLALDVSPDDLVRRGSLAPVPVATRTVEEPAPSTLSGASLSVPGAEPMPSRSPAPAAAPLVSPAGAPPLSVPAAQDAARRSSRPPPAPLVIAKPAVAPASLARRLAPGLGIAAGSIVVTLLASVYAAATSEVFSLGPIKASTIAALLLVVGLGLAAREFFRQPD